MKKTGISLIVLIVTIIVIIILAAVVILTLSKNNPIESAKEASFKEDVRTFQDELSMYISKDYTNKAGARDYRIIAVQLEKIQKYIPSFNKNYERKFVIKEDTLVYNEEKLNENELKYVESLNMHKNVKSDSEKVEETPNSYYGKTVNYKTGNSTIDSDITSWKIFYSDGANIYLISSTYVDPDNLPEKDGAKPDQGDAETYPKGARFNNILSKYSGSADITDEKIRELNFEYFVTNNFTSIESNMKAVAYMLDTKIWNKYAGGNGAEYAIGGPTIEMLLKSYCGKYPNKDYRAKAVSDIGYQISKNGDTNYSNSITSILNRSLEHIRRPSICRTRCWSSQRCPRQNGWQRKGKKQLYQFILYYSGYVKVYIDGQEVVPERWRTAWNPNAYKFATELQKGKKAQKVLE